MNLTTSQFESDIFEWPSEWYLRTKKFEEVEKCLHHKHVEERVKFHQELRFFNLLEFSERVILRKMFPNELRLKPEFLFSDSQKLSWDQKARLFVHRFVIFKNAVEKSPLKSVTSVGSDQELVICGITSSGSYLLLTTPDKNGNRKFSYTPLCSISTGKFSGRERLSGGLQLYNKGGIGQLHLSEMAYIAVWSPVNSEEQKWLDFFMRELDASMGSALSVNAAIHVVSG